MSLSSLVFPSLLLSFHLLMVCRCMSLPLQLQHHPLAFPNSESVPYRLHTAPQHPQRSNSINNHNLNLYGSSNNNNDYHQPLFSALSAVNDYVEPQLAINANDLMASDDAFSGALGALNENGK